MNFEFKSFERFMFSVVWEKTVGANKRCKKENSFLLSAKDAAVTYHTPARLHQPKSNYDFMLEKKGEETAAPAARLPLLLQTPKTLISRHLGTHSHTLHTRRGFFIGGGRGLRCGARKIRHAPKHISAAEKRLSRG